MIARSRPSTTARPRATSSNGPRARRRRASTALVDCRAEELNDSSIATQLAAGVAEHSQQLDPLPVARPTASRDLADLDGAGRIGERPGQQVGGLIHPGSRGPDLSTRRRSPVADVAGIRSAGDDRAHPRRGEARSAPARPAGLARVAADGVGAVGDAVHPRCRSWRTGRERRRVHDPTAIVRPCRNAWICRISLPAAVGDPTEGEIDGIGGVARSSACRATRPGSASRRRRRCRPRRRSVGSILGRLGRQAGQVADEPSERKRGPRCRHSRRRRATG